jgi:hypothetical protein
VTAVATHPEAAPPLGDSLDQAKMSRVHVRFWLLAGLGIMLDGFDFFIIGVANPLIAEDGGGQALTTPRPSLIGPPQGAAR